MKAKDTEPLDAKTLTQFTGTAQYWRVARQFVITDGVKYLAENAHCFWLIDAVISHLLEIGTLDWFVLVRTEVSGASAVMIYEDGNGAEYARQAIPYTDLQLLSVNLYAVWDSERWERASLDEELELAAHRARMAEEEKRAIGYRSKFL